MNPTHYYYRPGPFGSLFWVIITLVLILDLGISGMVAKYHLSLEQEWSANMQEVITIDLEVIASQKQYIQDLEDIIRGN